jgi:hypothetical protein
MLIPEIHCMEPPSNQQDPSIIVISISFSSNKECTCTRCVAPLIRKFITYTTLHYAGGVVVPELFNPFPNLIL